jgi:methionyl aminopeptidase
MIILKNREEIEKMKKSGAIIKKLFEEIDAHSIVKVGVTTKSIDLFIGNFIRNNSAIPSFLNYRGFPANSCISINDTVVHGIPNNYLLKDGDVVSVDVGVYADGYHADAARTYVLNVDDKNIIEFVETAKKSFFEALKVCKVDKRIGDISNSIQRIVEEKGYSVIW